MVEQTFESYSRNGEDVVAWRALKHVEFGRYVDVRAVGATDPSAPSSTRGLSERGWHGITVEPTATLNQVLTDAHWSGADIHLVTIDADGAEAEVLATLDLTMWRPWVLVIAAEPSEAASAGEQSVLDAGYTFCLFDGVSRYYVCDERRGELGANLSYPACIRDNYRSPAQRAHEIAQQAAIEDAIRWRAIALTRWSESLSSSIDELNWVNEELDAMRATLSWRITAPLRSVKRRGLTGTR